MPYSPEKRQNYDRLNSRFSSSGQLRLFVLGGNRERYLPRIANWLVRASLSI